MKQAELLAVVVWVDENFHEVLLSLSQREAITQTIAAFFDGQIPISPKPLETIEKR